MTNSDFFYQLLAAANGEMERRFSEISMPLIKALVCLDPMVTDRYLEFDYLKPLVDLLHIADGDKLKTELVVSKSFILTTIAKNDIPLAKGFGFLSFVLKILLSFRELQSVKEAFRH